MTSMPRAWLARQPPAPRLGGGRLVVDLGGPHRSLAAAVLGGGLGIMRSWLNLHVPAGYGRTDPDVHLRQEAAAAGLAGPVVGMLTAAPLERYQQAAVGEAWAVATVGVSHALAAAATRPRSLPPRWAASTPPAVGTINLLVVVAAPLTDAGLAGALQTAVEAKAQAVAAAQVPAANADGFATGTATDAICVACPLGSRVPFAGPATGVGGDLARAVFAAVTAGVAAQRAAGAAAGQARTAMRPGGQGAMQR
jgi:adenosylcobinamide amidohydrolase